LSLIRRSDLKPFQERAASALAEMIQEYPSNRFKPRYNPDTGTLLPFLCRLRAITGAGKTPILALAAQHLKTGVVLWTTNRGAVISQTLMNLRPGGKYSALLPEGTQIFQLGEMSPSDWDQAMQATDGLTIMLSTVAAFNQDGDNLKIHQKYGDVTRWDMLGGAAKTRGGRVRPLYVFYDEGHGATERQFQKLRELDPRAFVLASASPLPDDLADLLSGKTPDERQESLKERTVSVSTKEVVEAGLLKNRLYFIDCNTAKADAIREANSKWADLTTKLRSFDKKPIACFIVNETTRGVDIWEQLVQLGVNPTKIAVHLNGARDVIFDRRGTSSTLIDTYSGKKPQDRSPEMLASAGYTHIIWNLTLREGWDEPMAYVAYLDDKGRSAVDIVQKIGRFVRQPDASPFSDPDLNSAYFYFNVSDEAFSKLITETQQEMETDGYEVIPIENGRRPPSSRSVAVRNPKSLSSIAPWFGDSIQDLDRIVLDHVPLFAAKALQADGSIKTRVFEMAQLQEAVELRSESRRNANDTITPWEFLSVRLGSIDSRIVNDNGTIFSGTLKDDEKLKQPMQFGSDAMTTLATAVPQIKERLNEKFLLKSLGRHGIHTIKSFKLVSPDIDGGTEAYREKYKVRRFKNSLHAEYNGFNPFELRVAEELDGLSKPWCRNPVGKDGYKIPIQELGSDTIWFYPDFLLWTKQNEVWALDPKGKHLLEGAVTHKLLDLGSLKGISPTIRVAFVLEGSYTVDQQGGFSSTGRDGFTLLRKPGTKPKAVHFDTLKALVKELA
jgi:type III restriction enzyme